MRTEIVGFWAQIESDKFDQMHDTWDEHLDSIRGVPHFRNELGTQDPGSRYTGNKMTDLELFLGYYRYSINVRHNRSALLQLFWKPSLYRAIPGLFNSWGPDSLDTPSWWYGEDIPSTLREDYKVPPWLKDVWSLKDEVPMIDSRNVGPELRQAFELILKRNGMYKGTYHSAFDGQRLKYRALLEHFVLIGLGLLTYWAYRLLNREDPDPGSELSNPASDFELSHRQTQSDEQLGTDKSKCREGLTEKIYSPSLVWTLLSA